MISETVYQSIYDELSKYIMPGWEKLIVYLEYGVASYSFSFFIKKGNVFIKCYDLPNVSEDDLAESFRKIDVLVAKERDRGKDTWSNMTMLVDPSGNMRTDFDYTDLSQGSYQYKKEWKKKYLNEAGGSDGKVWRID